MFVGANSFGDIKQYFKEKLQDRFSANELKSILRDLTVNRFKISDLDYLTFDGNLSESDLLYYHFALKRLLKNEPIQYILGETEFFGLRFDVEPGVLIPRPETEELVAWVSGSHKNESGTIVDICSGSGCIAISLAKSMPGFNVVGLEISDEALEIAAKNNDKLSGNVDFRKFDALGTANYKDLKGTDVWVSNPPYIPFSDSHVMAENVLDYEPHVALFVEDNDPLIFYRIITENAKLNLKAGGWVYFEIHEDNAYGVKDLFTQNGFVNIEVRKDLQNKPRMVRGQKVL
ncbi:MAG: peptide chain release factor N(5)-glutamine methyltransferase [Crocinitomicaceae bacterium]